MIPALTMTPSVEDIVVHRDAMLRFARRKIRDHSLAEDAVQDALMSALRSRAAFRGASALKTWLIGILNHKIQDTFRRESRYVAQDMGPGQEPPGPNQAFGPHASALEAGMGEDVIDDPAEQVAWTQLRASIAREVDALPDNLREVFTLQALEGLPTETVCTTLGITPANCWVRLHRARKRLAERLADHRG